METLETKTEMRALGYPHGTETGGESQDATAESFKCFTSNNCQECSSVPILLYRIFRLHAGINFWRKILRINDKLSKWLQR